MKIVTQAIPTYILSVFLLPLELCTELKRMMNSFWWGKYQSTEKGIHWLEWGKMCKSKFLGGLGFKKIHESNLALLGKQGWRLINYPSSLVAQIYKARYYSNSSFLHVKLGHNPSYA